MRNALGPATSHTVVFTVREDGQRFTTTVQLIDGYTTTDDIPSIIRIAIMDRNGEFKGERVTPDDVHVVTVDGVAL